MVARKYEYDIKHVLLSLQGSMTMTARMYNMVAVV